VYWYPRSAAIGGRHQDLRGAPYQMRPDAAKNAARREPRAHNDEGCHEPSLRAGEPGCPSPQGHYDVVVYGRQQNEKYRCSAPGLDGIECIELKPDHRDLLYTLSFSYFVPAGYLRSLYEDHHFKGIVTKEWSPVECRERIRSIVNGYPHLFGHSGLEYV
jgi:hypothetical protein